MRYYLIVALVIGIVSVNAEECDITEAAADACANNLMVIGNRNFTIPKDDNDMLERCAFIGNGLKCYKDYAKNCLDSFSKQVIAMVIKNGHKMADKICKTESGRKEIMDNMQCFITEEAMAPLHLCMDKYIVQMESLGDIPSAQRIPSTCCTFHMLRDCVKAKSAASCENTDSIDYMDNIVTTVTGDLIGLVCNKFKDLEDCDAKMDSTIWQTLKDLVASDDPQEIQSKKKFSSPFAALKDILKKFRN